MPEILTKYPQVVLQILKEAGLKCGAGATQKILTQCPQDRFCSLPTGELCIYGLDEIDKMTQISIQELRVGEVVSLNYLYILIFAILAFSFGFFISKLLERMRGSKK